MDPELYHGEINKQTDWGGDESTGGLPVAGNRVQEYIKKTLNGKAGEFYYDEDNNRYLVFADVEDRDAYLAERDRTDLLLAIISGGGGSSDRMIVTLESDYYMAILPNQKGIYIEFTFETRNSSNMPTGDDALVTFTFRWNSVVKTVTQKYTAGSRVRFALDDYLGDSGITNVSIRVVGQESLATTSFSVICNKIDLALSDSYNVGQVYNLIETPDAVASIPYSLQGQALKTMEWYLDGEKLPSVKNEDEITEVSASRVKYIPLSGLSEGVHNVQFRAYVTINGEKFYSQTLYREVLVYKGENNLKTLIAIGVDLGIGSLIEKSQQLILENIQQYLPYSFKIGIFNPTYAASTDIEIQLNEDIIGVVSLSNGTEQIYTFVPTISGSGKLSFICEGNRRDMDVSVEGSSTSISEITGGLSLDLRALGKSNTSPAKASWTYGRISTRFTGFDWNGQSGWNDNRLVIPEGASIVVEHSPLGGYVTQTGKTLEFEFSTSNVTDDDAVICDLRNGDTGLLITASEASLSSAGGTKVSVKYKAGEDIRVSFVINRNSDVIDKQLVFIYVNGILSGAANYSASDNFLVNKDLSFVGVGSATIRLKHLRFYDVALTADQILNNYMLYQDDVAKMLAIYDRNNIFEEGTTDFSTDILSRQLPVMIITGNIPALEATTDKNLQIVVDVDYINMQNPELSFKMKGAAMRPQGTSSMGYPKKNFRLYSDKLVGTEVYDSEGNPIENRLYSFRKNAQPVNCWCFKADYAESSGAHNTGIGRLWNDVLVNTQIDGEYKLRTEAQKTAIQNGYVYDVRTTIDGFPILMFYRTDANSPLVFIGKYNFNNDKSTESVFGFKGIPGFDNSKVECWEVLNNGNHLALFTDTANWETEWDEAFEGRYPDGNDNTTALRRFADWMSTVTQSNFATEKWAHLDVYKVAAYYIYLIRFGAVDQVVKNAMFTTEDGEHWFYINYDNDTINGLRNDGLLIYPPTIDRQTLDNSFSSEVYAYAGHDSRLWNMLEADPEFMEIVSKVDSALYTAGLSYANVIKEFDTEQTDKWCERVYNQDAQYKYVGPFRSNGTNNLFMLQGSRKSHRRWWLSRRFNLIDGKLVSGAYKDNVFEVKLAGAPIGLRFSIIAGFDMNYGYGVNNIPIESGIHLRAGESHEFTTKSVLNVGDPLRLYTAPNIRKIDISEFMPYLSQLSMAGVLSSEIGTALEELVINKSGATNSALTELSGISNASKLKVLRLGALMALGHLDLSGNLALQSVDIADSGVTALTLPKGAPVTSLALPAAINIMELRDLPKLQTSGLTVAGDYAGVTSLIITNCPMIDKQNILDKWMNNKSTPNAYCSVEIDDVNFENISADYLLKFASFMSVNFSGKASLTSLTAEEASQLLEVFGAGCFNASAKFFIKVPNGFTGLIGPSEVKSGQSVQYSFIGNYDETIGLEWSVSPQNDKISISNNGLLTVGMLLEDTDVTVTAKGQMVGSILTLEGSTIVRVKRAIELDEADVYISGNPAINSQGSYRYELKFNKNFDSSLITTEWSLEENEIASVISSSTTECTVQCLSDISDGITNLYAEIKSSYTGETLFKVSFSINFVEGEVIMTSESNPTMMQAMFENKVAKNRDYLLRSEAEACTDYNIIKKLIHYRDGESFDEFVYFINAPLASVTNTTGNKPSSLTLPYETMEITSTVCFRADNLKCPRLRRIEVSPNNFNRIFDVSESLDLPVLEYIGSTYSDFTLNTTGAMMFAKNINAPLLAEVNISRKTPYPSETNAQAYVIRLYDSNIETFIFPKLKYLRNINLIDASQKTTKTTCIFDSSEIRGIGSSSYALCRTEISSDWTVGDIEVIFNAETFQLGNSSYLISYFEGNVVAPNLTSLIHPAVGFPIKKWITPKLEMYWKANSFSNYNSYGYSWANLEYLEVLDFKQYNNSTTQYDAPSAPKLHTIKIHADVAPTIIKSFPNLGSEVDEAQSKMLYLKEGATGYDAEIWNTPPMSDYTKSFTL